MTTNNNLNIKSQGVAYRSTSGAFSGLDGGSASKILRSAGIGLAPFFTNSTAFLSASGNFTAVKNNQYVLTAAATVTLPLSPITGDSIALICNTSSNVIVKASAGQVISIQNVISDYAGTATSSAIGNTLTLVYNSSDTSWIAFKVIGSWVLNDFSPPSIANGYTWLDGDSPRGGATPPNGSNILPIDKMGVMIYTQNTATRRPIFNTGILNGRGALFSSPANNTSITNNNTTNLLTATTSIIMLAQPSSSASAYLMGSDGTGNSPAIISNFGGLSYEWFNGVDRYTISAGATGFNLIEIYQTDSVNIIGFLNGVQVFSNTPTVAISGRSWKSAFSTFGGLNIYTGYIAEHFMYTAILTAAQKKNIRRYIAQKWGLAIPS